MGLEADCEARVNGKAVSGRALLETSELVFRGARPLRIPLKAVRSAVAKAGQLEIRYEGGSASFGIGEDAEKWALKIRHPKRRIDKLGVKPGARVAVLGLDDAELLEELAERTDDVVTREPKKDSDLVFALIKDRSELHRLRSLRAALKPEGGIWVLWPKGQKALREDDLRAAGPALGLVDVKVVSFSDTLSGLKMVIPLALRPKARARSRPVQ